MRACFFGIAESVACLIELQGCDINKIDYTENTPLKWAAWNRHQGVVEILLGRNINPSPLDMDGRTPLCLAAVSGHAGVVKILLGWDDVAPGRLDMFGWTALCCAAESGREGAADTPVRRDDVNPDTLDSDGWTPLSLLLGMGTRGWVGCCSDETMWMLTRQIHWAECPSVVLLRMGTRGLWKYHLDGVNSTLTSRICPTEHHSLVIPEGVVRVLL